MPTHIQRRAINDDLSPNWDAAEHSLRSAMEVIDWCAGEHISLAGLEARDLHTAMAEMPAERQSPADYLDMAAALAAVTRARPSQSVNADLLALARRYAADCAGCDGAGTRTITTYPGGIEVDNDDQPCPTCADIRAAITKATQS